MKIFICAIFITFLIPNFMPAQTNPTIDEKVFCLLGKKYNALEVNMFWYKLVGIPLNKIHGSESGVTDKINGYAYLKYEHKDSTIREIQIYAHPDDKTLTEFMAKGLMDYLGINRKYKSSLKNKNFELVGGPYDPGSLFFNINGYFIHVKYKDMKEFDYLKITFKDQRVEAENCYPEAADFIQTLPENVKNIVLNEDYYFITYPMDVQWVINKINERKKEKREKFIADSIWRREQHIQDSIAQWRENNKDKIPTIWDEFFSGGPTLYSMTQMFRITTDWKNLEDLIFKYDFECDNYPKYDLRVCDNSQIKFYTTLNGDQKIDFMNFHIKNNDELSYFGWTKDMSIKDFIDKYGDNERGFSAQNEYSFLAKTGDNEASLANLIDFQIYFNEDNGISFIKIGPISYLDFIPEQGSRITVYPRCLSGDCENGTGKFYISKNLVYSGTFKNGIYVEGQFETAMGEYKSNVKYSPPVVESDEKKDLGPDPAELYEEIMLNIQHGVDACTELTYRTTEVDAQMKKYRKLVLEGKAWSDEYYSLLNNGYGLTGPVHKAIDFFNEADRIYNDNLYVLKDYFSSVGIVYSNFINFNDAAQYTVGSLSKWDDFINNEFKTAVIYVREDSKFEAYEKKSVELMNELSDLIMDIGTQSMNL